MFIRYFARTDESDIGRAAVAYCDSLVATGIPVRLVSTRVADLQLDRLGRGGGIWGRFRNLLITPMDGGYVNVVCGDPSDWERLHTPGALRNVLLLGDSNLAPSVSQPELMDAVAKYDYVIAPSAELATVAERVTCLRPIVVKPGGAVDHLRTVLAC